MTKAVRIENADTSDYKILVETWVKGMDGNPDVKVSEQPLSFPTAMSSGLHIHSGRYLIVKEVSV